MSVYGPEIKEAAMTLHMAGLKSREIKERLEAGTAGLPYKTDPSERTIDKWRAQWKREGVKTALAVRAEDVEKTEELIYRRFLGLMNQRMSELEDATIDGSSSTSQVNQIGAFFKIMNGVQYQRQLRDSARKRKLTPQEGAALSGPVGMAKPESMLDMLAREERDSPSRNPVPTNGSV
jgi:hypothetical protein